MAFCHCMHDKVEHNDLGQCCANVQVMHDGQAFIKRCLCTKYREDRPKTLREITPEELLKLPMQSPHYM